MSHLVSNWSIHILLCLTELQARLDMYWKCTDKTAKGGEIVMVQQHNTARVTRRYLMHCKSDLQRQPISN